MKKNIDLVIDGIVPEKVMYDTDNHSLVVLYPAQEEFKKGDILASDNKTLLIFDGYANKEKYLLHSLWNNTGISNINWQTKAFKHATDEQKEQVHELLRKEGKKWNAETLQVEDLVDEFKRGDIVIHDNTKRISVFDKLRNNNLGFDAIFGLSRFNEVHDYCSWNTRTLRHATPQEIEQFDNDLKSIGKKWNRETLEIEELDISEIAVDLVSACEYLKEPIPQNYVYHTATKFEKQINAQITLQLIREAWNKHDEFEVDWNDNEQNNKYFIIIDDDKIATSCHNVVKTIELACYSFPTRERALQFGTQFKELFKTAMGL